MSWKSILHSVARPDPRLPQRGRGELPPSEFSVYGKNLEGLTHERKATAADKKLFKDGLEPLVNGGQLGAVLLRFPWSFKNESENRVYVRQLRERFPDYRPVLEVRHSS